MLTLQCVMEMITHAYRYVYIHIYTHAFMHTDLSKKNTGQAFNFSLILSLVFYYDNNHYHNKNSIS